MQKTIQSIADVSILFFVVFGGLHIGAALMLAQGVSNNMDQILFNSLDLPFLLSALLYGSARLALALAEVTGNIKIPFVICSVFSVAVFSGALYLNFALSDANLF